MNQAMQQTVTMEDLDTLAAKIAAAIKGHAVPLKDRLWNSDDCADYFRQSQSYFTNTTCKAPTFPSYSRLERKGRPLWNAQEVIDWAKSWRMPR